MILKLAGLFLLLPALTACDDSFSVWNDPYSAGNAEANTLYLSFTEPPKRLDPATVYLSNEIHIVSQIYEPALQYHYLLRPYTLIPQTVTQIPVPQYFASNDQPLPANAAEDQIAYTVYELQLKPGIYYQPHPAFAQDQAGNYLYHHLTAAEIKTKTSMRDFPQIGTRELVAADYVYQIKRLASPNTFSPILTFMQDYIIGLEDYTAQLAKVFQTTQSPYVDLRQYPLAGAEAIDRYTYQIKIKGKYPQFLNWLAMHFFSPMPWEADAFYQQPGLAENNISINWQPIGTGPYLLAENNPNQHMVLLRNPNYHGETFPTEGMPEDAEEGLLQLAGQPLPFLDSLVYTLEKESIPQWSKFLQGYYDYLRLDTSTFEQAVQFDASGMNLSSNLRDKNLKLYSRSSAAVYYWGFNMLDPVVGGYTDQARKLRKAISLVVDMQEYTNIFLNGLAEVGTGPIPPEIFGYAAEQALAAKAPPMSMEERIDYAKKLLIEAGYPNGRNAKTGEPLVLGYDSVTKGGPDSKANLGWMRKQFEKLGIELEVRATQLSRFQQKMRTGTIQLFYWTWVGDYPDPENFLFLFYGPSAVAVSSGSNRSNYQNPAYDALFNQMKNMESTPAREAIISQMLQILEEDTPWFAEIYPYTFTIDQSWVYPMKPSDMVRNTQKYQKVDAKLRAEKRQEWNPPLLWPLFSLAILIIILALPVVISYYRKQFKKPNKE